MKTSTLILFFFAALAISCSNRTPEVLAYRPWLRLTGDASSIQPGTSVSVSVLGQGAPLLGAENLINEKMKSELSELLARRGVNISTTESRFKITLRHKTERFDAPKSSISISYSGRTNGVSGLGVNAAQEIALAAISSETKVGVSIKTNTERLFTHSAGIEILDNYKLIWKGDSTWDSKNLDIVSDARPAIQLALANFPSQINQRNVISDIKDSHVNIFYNLECKNKWFVCPALPYRVKMEMEDNPNPDEIPRAITSSAALVACRDLLETAEFAIPIDSKNRIVKSLNGDLKLNILDNKIWSRVELNGKYAIGKRTANIVLILSGQESGYYIESCKLVDDSEFQTHEKLLSEWKATLADFYSMYK